jgi:hypothetical protein
MTIAAYINRYGLSIALRHSHKVLLDMPIQGRYEVHSSSDNWLSAGVARRTQKNIILSDDRTPPGLIGGVANGRLFEDCGLTN